MKTKVDQLTTSSVDSLLAKVRSLGSRPLADFNKYEALDLVDALQKLAHDTHHEKEAYYRLAFETLRGKLSQTDAMFRNYLLPIFGDKDHEKILDIVGKVEKSAHRSGSPMPNRFRPSSAPYAAVRCFNCNRLGHMRNACPRPPRVSNSFRNRPAPSSASEKS